jgi:hypothetical protein
MATTVILGTSARKFGEQLPSLIRDYAPDIFWALMVFWTLGFIFISKPISWIALIALLISYAIEATQLYHAPFIDSIRRTTVGGMMLGYDFIWSDIFSYTSGVLLGVLIEIVVYRAAFISRS